MNRLKNFTVAVVAISAAFLCAVTAGAEIQSYNIVSHTIDGQEVPVTYDAEGVPRFTYIESISAYISGDNGKASCTGSVMADPSYTRKLTVSLLKSKDGRDWNTDDYWTVSGGKDRVLILSQSRYIERGQEYKAITTATVGTGSHKEVVSAESSTLYY